MYGFGGPGAGPAKSADPAAILEETLAAYLNTLLPKSERSPDAVEAGVLNQILGAARSDRDAQAFLGQGVRWLNEEARKQAGQDFGRLSNEETIAVVEAAETAPWDSLENEFFRTTRFVALNLYYVTPESWPAIGYDGPPQPVGFPDYTDRPAGEE
jgi:hypothetical protein